MMFHQIPAPGTCERSSGTGPASRRPAHAAWAAFGAKSDALLQDLLVHPPSGHDATQSRVLIPGVAWHADGPHGGGRPSHSLALLWSSGETSTPFFQPLAATSWTDASVPSFSFY